MATRNRQAYSLLELMLVLALIVVIAGLSYPYIEGMSGPYKVQAASDATQTAMAQAHVHAMDEGRSYRFSVVPGRGNFRIAPDSDEFWGNGDVPNDPDNPAFVHEDVLPTQVRFNLNGAGNNSSETSHAVGEVPSGDWVPVVIFNSDGTASEDVQISFQCSSARAMTIHLRALTGTTSVSYDPAEGK